MYCTFNAFVFALAAMPSLSIAGIVLKPAYNGYWIKEGTSGVFEGVYSMDRKLSPQSMAGLLLEVAKSMMQQYDKNASKLKHRPNAVTMYETEKNDHVIFSTSGDNEHGEPNAKKVALAQKPPIPFHAGQILTLVLPKLYKSNEPWEFKAACPAGAANCIGLLKESGDITDVSAEAQAWFIEFTSKPPNYIGEDRASDHSGSRASSPKDSPSPKSHKTRSTPAQRRAIILAEREVAMRSVVDKMEALDLTVKI